MKLRNNLYDNFKGVPTSVVDTAIEGLRPNQKELLYYIWGEDNKPRNTNNKQARFIIEQIENNLYKKNILDLFDAEEDVVKSLVNSLKPDQRKYLFLEYSFTREIKEPIDDKITYRNWYTINKIRKAIKSNKKEFGPNRRKGQYKGFFNQFNYSKEEVLRAVNSLNTEDINTLKKKFGSNLEGNFLVDDKTNEEINVRICRQIRRTIESYKNGSYVKITDLVNEDIDTIKERMNLLPKREQAKVYNLFGDNLDKEVACKTMYIDSLLAKNIITRLSESRGKFRHTSFKPLIDSLELYRLPLETNMEFLIRIKSAVEALSEKDKLLLKKKYGENLDKTMFQSEISIEENNYILHTVMYKIRFKLKEKKIREYKGLFDRVNPDERGLLLMFIDTLSDEDKALLKKKYGEDYTLTSRYGSMTKEENKRIKDILSRGVSYFNSLKQYKYNNVNINTLRDMRNILRSDEFNYLKGIFGENKSLAVLTYLARKNISVSEIEEVTGVTKEELDLLVIEYNKLNRDISVLKRKAKNI